MMNDKFNFLLGALLHMKVRKATLGKAEDQASSMFGGV